MGRRDEAIFHWRLLRSDGSDERKVVYDFPLQAFRMCSVQHSTIQHDVLRHLGGIQSSVSTGAESVAAATSGPQHSIDDVSTIETREGD